MFFSISNLFFIIILLFFYYNYFNIILAHFSQESLFLSSIPSKPRLFLLDSSSSSIDLLEISSGSYQFFCTSFIFFCNVLVEVQYGAT